MSKLLSVDNEYKEWLQDVSHRFKRSQIKAAIKVNDEMRLNFLVHPAEYRFEDDASQDSDNIERALITVTATDKV